MRQRFRLPVLAAALAVIPIIWIEETTSNPELLMTAKVANWVIWGVFAGEYAALAAADRRWWRTRETWLNLAVVAVSFPLLGAVFATARLLWLLRLLRLGACGRGGCQSGGGVPSTRVHPHHGTVRDHRAGGCRHVRCL